MHIKEPLRIDMRHASLFLSKAYEGWIASPKEGKFPSGFGPEWQMINTSSVNRSDFIGLYSSLADLPDITFKNSKDSKGKNTGFSGSRMRQKNCRHGQSRIREVEKKPYRKTGNIH